jgi:hypothetical protein
MTEEEANKLLAEIETELGKALQAWRYTGTIGLGVPHMIIPSPSREEDKLVVQEVFPNHSGVAGAAAGSVYALESIDDVVTPVRVGQPRWDGTARRLASSLEFVPAGSTMGIVVNDPYGVINGSGCCEVSDGVRPSLNAFGSGKYALFKRSFCTVDRGSDPYLFSRTLWEYVLVPADSEGAAWVPTSSFGGEGNVLSGLLYKLVHPSKVGSLGGFFIISDPLNLGGFDFTFEERDAIFLQNDDFGYGSILDNTFGHPPSGAVVWSGAYPDCPP